MRPYSPFMAFADELAATMRAGYTAIAVLTHEEERVEAIAAELAKSSKRALKTWSASKATAGAQAVNAVDALTAMAADAGPSIWVVKDVHPFLGDPRVVRLLRDIAGTLSPRSVILVGPSITVPPELEKDITVLELPLPHDQELAAALAELVAAAPAAQPSVSRIGAPVLASAARGLTLREARRAFRRALEGSGTADPNDLLDRVIAEKRKLLRNTRFLEYTEPRGASRSVGGLGELRKWLTQRAAAFKPEARTFGLSQPKGVFLLGVQGCGKSLAAKAVADLWRLPLLRLDAGAVIDGGSLGPAANLRQAITIAEALSPCVLWIDEIEKFFADEARKGEGAATRVMGAFVTWLQEKTAPVFVVATANRVDTLSPELMRKGRFDEIFFVDLPGLHDRKEILQIHLASRGRDPKAFDVEGLAKATDKYSGAELEAVVTAALFHAFAENRELGAADLKQAIEETVPLAITMEEDIRALRDWAKTRTRPAAQDTRRADLFGTGG